MCDIAPRHGQADRGAARSPTSGSRPRQSLWGRHLSLHYAARSSSIAPLSCPCLHVFIFLSLMYLFTFTCLDLLALHLSVRYEPEYIVFFCLFAVPVCPRVSAVFHTLSTSTSTSPFDASPEPRRLLLLLVFSRYRCAFPRPSSFLSSRPPSSLRPTLLTY